MATGILGRPADPKVPNAGGGSGGGGAFEERHARDVGGQFTSGPDANRGPQDDRMGSTRAPAGPGERIGPERMGTRQPRRPVRDNRMDTTPSRTQVAALQRLMRDSGLAPGLMDDGDLGPVTLGEFTRIRDTLGLADAASTVDMLQRIAAVQGVTPKPASSGRSPEPAPPKRPPRRPTRTPPGGKP